MVVLMAAGCGSSSSSPSTSSTTTTTHPVVQDIRADQGYAQDQLLTTADFPSGWTPHGSVTVGKSTDESTQNVFSETQSSELATCLGKPPQLAVVGAEAGSPTFVSPDSTSGAENTAFVYATATEAKADFPSFSNPKLPSCIIQGHEKDIADYVASAFSDGTTATSASATQATFPSYGDESGAVMITVPLTFPDGMKANVSITYIMIRQGRSIAQLVLDSVPGTFESSLAQSLAQTVTANMAKTPVRATN